MIIEQFNIGTILENLRVKIDAEKAVGADFKIGFNITDRDESYSYHVRNGIAAFYHELLDDADLVLNIPASVVYDFVLGRGTIRQSIESGTGTADGDLGNLATFAAFFDFARPDIELSSR